MPPTKPEDCMVSDDNDFVCNGGRAISILSDHNLIRIGVDFDTCPPEAQVPACPGADHSIMFGTIEVGIDPETAKFLNRTPYSLPTPVSVDNLDVQEHPGVRIPLVQPQGSTDPLLRILSDIMGQKFYKTFHESGTIEYIHEACLSSRDANIGLTTNVPLTDAKVPIRLDSVNSIVQLEMYRLLGITYIKMQGKDGKYFHGLVGYLDLALDQPNETADIVPVCMQIKLLDYYPMKSVTPEIRTIAKACGLKYIHMFDQNDDEFWVLTSRVTHLDPVMKFK